MDEEGYCLRKLLEDVIKNGVCDFPGDDPNPFTVFKTDECEINLQNVSCPVLCPVQSCDLSCPVIVKGVCSAETENILMSEECAKTVGRQPLYIVSTIIALIARTCNIRVITFYFNYFDQLAENLGLIGDKKVPKLFENSQERFESNLTRLVPFSFTRGKLDLITRLNFKNTLNRYPWICSLRSTGTNPEHLCAVVLLSIPPKPTIFVGAAHCTYLCKNRNKKRIPACCCSGTNGPEDCSENNAKCGKDPRVYIMEVGDARIVCGEHETGPVPSNLSGEKYNVAFPILEIVRHPNFNATKGPISGSDIAVFKVDDKRIQNNEAASLKLWPACFPSSANESKTGIHSGWSKPPPFPFVEQRLPGYINSYRDFFKQWHYKMDIFDTCKDPINSWKCLLGDCIKDD